MGADVGVLDQVSAPPPPAAGLVHQTQPNLVQPLRIDGPWTGDARDTQKSSGWTQAWLDPGLAGPWRLPLVLAAPHPVVRQDQLSFSSSSSSGMQTGEMLDAGDRQTTSGTFQGGSEDQEEVLTEPGRNAEAQQRQVRLRREAAVVGQVEDLVHRDGLGGEAQVVDSQDHHVLVGSATTRFLIPVWTRGTQQEPAGPSPDLAAPSGQDPAAVDQRPAAVVGGARLQADLPGPGGGAGLLHVLHQGPALLRLPQVGGA